MAFYPIMINLSDKQVVVIGGGDVALRKIRELIDAGARISVIAPDIHDEIDEICKRFPDRIEIQRREYRHGDLGNAFLAFSATNIHEVNGMILEESRDKGILLNAVDDPDNCTFIMPSSFRRGDLIVAVSTGGASPSMSAKLRRMIEETIPEDIETILEALKTIRSLLQSDQDFKHLDAGKRGEILKKIVVDDALIQQMVISRDEGRLKEFLKELAL
jgi:precorrin-2 dehydrogenase / sirohydrochlorin ferrochelatase